MVHERKNIPDTEEDWECLPEWFRKLRELFKDKENNVKV